MSEASLMSDDWSPRPTAAQWSTRPTTASQPSDALTSPAGVQLGGDPLNVGDALAEPWLKFGDAVGKLTEETAKGIGEGFEKLGEGIGAGLGALTEDTAKGIGELGEGLGRLTEDTAKGFENLGEGIGQFTKDSVGNLQRLIDDLGAQLTPPLLSHNDAEPPTQLALGHTHETGRRAESSPTDEIEQMCGAPEDFVTALEVLSVTDISPEVDGVRSIYL